MVSKFSPFCWILVSVLISISNPVFAQQKVWRHFTIEDGLPGEQVWSIMQARNGNIWISTNKGICWYDGYEFNQPVDTSSFIGTEVFFPSEDSKERIWFSRLDKTIWYVEDDTIRSWKYNPVIKQYAGNFQIIDKLTIDDTGAAWINMRGRGLLIIQPDGQHSIFRGSDHFNFTVAKKNKQIFFATQNSIQDKYGNGTPDTLDVVYWEHNKFNLLNRILNGISSASYNWSASTWDDNDILLSYNNQISIMRDGKIVYNFPSPILNPKIIKNRAGQIYAASYRGDQPGVFLYSTMEDLKNGDGIRILNSSVGEIFCDREGGVWATAIKEGLYYCKNTDVNLFNQSNGLNSDKIYRLVTDGKSKIFAGLGSNDVFEIDTNGIVQSIGSPCVVKDWMALFFDQGHQRLFGSSPLTYFTKNQWHELAWFNEASGESSTIDAKRITKDPLTGNLWMSSSNGFFNLDVKTLASERFVHPDTSVLFRTFAIQKDLIGNIWVASIDGLRIWENGEYCLPLFDHPALNHQARDLAMLSDGTIVIGFAGGGILLYQADGVSIHITKEHGLSSDVISLVKIGVENEIFACTNKGLNHLVRQADGNWKVHVITTREGLPSNLVHDVVRLRDELWIATEKGLVRMPSARRGTEIMSPQIMSFRANHRNITTIQEIRLPFDQNNISIRFQSLHFKSEGNIWYRFRLLNADTTFQISKSRELNYSQLSPGKYVFEVQAQREDNSWTESTRVSFEIQPPWWKTFWFISFCVLSIGFISAWIVRNRLNTDRKKAKADLKMKELQLSALRAQINPHFIFNCLSSIQQFIAENNTDTATRYLARFANDNSTIT